ncbi:MAG: hypothetical protein LC637_01565 [Xanthomonadaceae bacterium]|nr:hypothetical protein [Xanthomonadaceae bacterium]
MEWVSSTAPTILDWINAIAERPEAILLASILLFLVLALAIGLVFALDSEEPRPIRTIGWLLLICSVTAIGCSSISLLAL